MSDKSYPPIRRPGWRALERAEYSAEWDRFEKLFGFRANIDPTGWPAIREPTPSITFDLAAIGDGPTRLVAVAAINSEALRCFVWYLNDLPDVLVLDWQHEAWWLNTQVQASLLYPEDPVNGYPTVYPDGDYHYFLSPDMSEGTFGHPWEKTIYVFGERLVESLGKTLSSWLPASRIQGLPAPQPTHVANTRDVADKPDEPCVPTR